MCEPILLYDGVCGLCNRVVRFVLRRDRHDRFRFASLQSAFAVRLLERHGRRPEGLDTLYLVVDEGGKGEQLLSKSQAVLYILERLGGVWRLAALLRACPSAVLDAGYDVIARNRYRLFGRYETCLPPEEKWRRKFLDLGG